MLYGSETWPVKEEYMIRLERNDASIVRYATIGWMIKFLGRNFGLN